jgi:hypothetical protein
MAAAAYWRDACASAGVARSGAQASAAGVGSTGRDRSELSDPYAQKSALAALARACARIVAAPCGAQDSTRHAMCYLVGGLVGRGDLGYATAYAAILEAARAMPVYREPWRNLEERVARSLEAGIGRPLALSETELWVRNLRARMRLKRPMAPAGARNG